jgi:glycosyltransferase involved in cell wall biosynthesis
MTLRQSVMRVHVYAICWNESRVIDYFLRHYEPIAERIVVYDEDSNDGTGAILKAHRKVELRRFVRSNPDTLELSKIAVLNHCWKEARGLADWVIIVDCDEHVFHPRLTDYLAAQTRAGVTFVPTLGFQMITAQFPETGEHLATTRTMGIPERNYSKPCVFDPDAVVETNFGGGLHSASPIGRLSFPDRDEVMLLHYKYLGLDYVAQRYGALNARRGPTDVRYNWDYHFSLSPDHWERELADVASRATDVAARDFSPSAAHAPPSWRLPSAERGSQPLLLRGL